MDSRLKVISLWAGPGAGKSTLAAAVFARMKRLRYKVELVTEFAKDLTYEQSWKVLGDQMMVLAEQNFRLARLEGQVEWAITDSPLPLSLIYCKDGVREVLHPLVQHLWYGYHNFPFTLNRTTAPYQEFGRNQTLDQAVDLDNRVHTLAKLFGSIATLNPEDPLVEDKVIREINHRMGK